ncbi:MAG: cell division protein FtsB [Burkholderia sp.]
MWLVTVILIGLLVLIQYPLWWGYGGWLRVHELRQELANQTQKNAEEKLRNERISGEVQDLQNGMVAIEERARYEMGMVKDGEMFVQFVSPNFAGTDGAKLEFGSFADQPRRSKERAGARGTKPHASG